MGVAARHHSDPRSEILGVLRHREYRLLDLLRKLEPHVSESDFQDAIWELLNQNKIQISPKRTVQLVKGC